MTFCDRGGRELSNDECIAGKFVAIYFASHYVRFPAKAVMITERGVPARACVCVCVCVSRCLQMLVAALRSIDQSDVEEMVYDAYCSQIPACTAFTPVLTKLYESLHATGVPFEIVFVSCHHDASLGNHKEGTTRIPQHGFLFSHSALNKGFVVAWTHRERGVCVGIFSRCSIQHNAMDCAVVIDSGGCRGQNKVPRQITHGDAHV
jgi:hypothetical protein